MAFRGRWPGYPRIAIRGLERRRLRSHAVRRGPVLAVLSPYHRAGVLVVLNLLRLRIEVQDAADARGDVAQVAQRRGVVVDLDVAIGAGVLADAVEEVAV